MNRNDKAASPQSLSSITFVDIIILWCIPLFQATINDGWIYSDVGGIDSWVYFGYGLNYADPNYLDYYYKISRLPWVLLEFVNRSIFDPVIASWILQIGSLALGSASLYVLFARTLDRSSAFLGAAVFSAYPFAHSSGGADYHNTIAGSLYALTWWLAVRAGEYNSPLRLSSAGGAAALTVHSDINFINLVPIIALHYFYQRGFEKTWRSRLRAAIWPAFGATTITFVLGLCNKGFGRSFLFFSNVFDLALTFVLDPSNQESWYHSWSSGWYWNEPYIGSLAGSFILAILSLFMPKVRAHRQALIYCIGYVCAGSIWLFWQTLGQTALDWYYEAYPLVFPLIGFIAAMFAVWAPNSIDKLGLKLLVAGTVIVGIAIFSMALDLGRLNPPMVLALVLALSFGGSLIFSPPNARVWLGTAVLTLSMAFSLGYGAPEFYAPSRCALPRSFVLAIDHAHRLIRSQKEANNLTFEQVFFWADKSPEISYENCHRTISLSEFERSLASTLVFNYIEPPWMTENTDEIPTQSLKRVTSAGGLVVFITQNPERVERLRQRLSEEADGHPGNKQLYIIEAGALRLPMYLFLVAEN